MKVGDKVPWPEGVVYDPQLVRIAKSMRNVRGLAAKSNSRNKRISQAKLALSDQETRAARAALPVERAMTFLRHQGFSPVYDRRTVHGSQDRGYQVGKLRLADGAAVMEYARDRGWSE
jgi:hypothetical protein